MFSVLFACYQNYAKTTQSTVTKFGDKVARGPMKKRLGLSGYPDHVMSELGLW